MQAPPVMMYPATGMPVQGTPVMYPAPVQMPRSITTVPINLDSTGGLRFQVNSYSLALQPVLSRSEFDDIVSELNITCDKYAPNVGAHMAFLLIPLLGLPALPVLMHKMKRFKREVDATCCRLSKQYASKGINLRVVEFTELAGYGGMSHCHATAHAGHHGATTMHHHHGPRTTTKFRVDLEVAV